MLFKDFSIFSCGCHFFQLSRTVCAILVEGLMRLLCETFGCNYFEFGAVCLENIV